MTDEPLPALFRMSLYRGDTRVWDHFFADDPDEDGTPGAPIDITDWDFLAQYKASTEDVTPIAVDDLDITDGPGGVLRRTLTTEESAKLPKGKISWDLQAIKPDGSLRTYLKNKSVRVEGDVSR